MIKEIIAFSLLILINLINLTAIVWREKIMNNYSGIINLILNYQVWIIILLSMVMFGLNFAVMYLISINKTIIFSWCLVIPIFFLSLYSSYRIFGEIIQPAQIKYLVVLVISMIIGIIGTIGFVINGK
jgi:hypothetical protein